MVIKKLALMGLTSIALAATGLQAQAADYPSQPITLVVPFSAGGGADNAARIIAQGMEAVSGQTVVVENKAGASGSIGAGQVARARPNGYTVLFDASSFALNPVLRKLPYDAKKDFIPVSQAIVVPNILVVAPGSAFQSLDDLIKAAKAAPGDLTYASYGPGSLAQMAAELLIKDTGIEMVHVPYKGGAPAMVDVIAGHVDAYFANAASSLNYVTSDRLRALAVTSTERMPELPNVPTVAEAAIKDFSVYEWNGLFVPGGTDGAIVQKLHEIVKETLALPDVTEKLKNLGLSPVGSTPEEFAAFLADEDARWRELVKANNISLD
ncbi:MAG: tripartite tricarboxylate transporter substrate binding protein [Pusillimonas sp.]